MESLYKRLSSWWVKYARPIKVIFVISVIIFVVHALTSFFKTVDWHRIKQFNMVKHPNSACLWMYRSYPNAGIRFCNC